MANLRGKNSGNSSCFLIFDDMPMNHNHFVAQSKKKRNLSLNIFFSPEIVSCTQKSNERRNDAFLRAIPALSEKLPKWHFLIHACNSNIFWAKLLLLKCFESATKWLYPKNVSGSVQVLKQRIKVDKLDFFKNAS